MKQGKPPVRKLAFALCLLAWPVAAQTTVQPGQRTSIAVNGTITTGGTFQSIMAANSNRTSCSIQNTSTHTMYFYLGATASATTSNSLQVAPGGLFYCLRDLIVATDNVAITTSTTADTFAGFYQN